MISFRSNRSAALCAAAILLITILPLLTEQVRSQQEEEPVASFDFEEDDGGFSHGGDTDSWEWGVPFPVSAENPGPSSAGEGARCFATDLNGTYRVSERSYLSIPDLNVGSYMDISLDYLIWFDLSYQEDERNGTGTEVIADHLLVQVMDAEQWITVANHSGSSDGQWLDLRVDLSSFDLEVLSVRFLLVDVEDGLVDNGAYIDMVAVNGILRPVVDISLRGSPSFHSFVPGGQPAKVFFTVENNGRTIPPDSEVRLSVLGPEGTSPQTSSERIRSERIYRDFLVWVPEETGTYELTLELIVDGETVSKSDSETTTLNPIFYDGFDLGLDLWSFSVEEGDAEWFPAEPDPEPPTISGRMHLEFGGPSGFQGSSYAILRGPEVDLSLYNEAYLRIYHSYGFMGEQGSSGGLVQALDGSGSWITLEPDLPHTRVLKDSISGPMEGEFAFQGDRDWYQVGFDMLSFTGGRTRLRFVVSSGEDGEGRGWSIDDVMLTGEGIDPDDTVPPEPVQGVSISVIGEGWIEVDWMPSFALDLDHYKIYLGSGTGPVRRSDLYAIIGPDNTTSLGIRDLEPSIDQWVLVTAVDVNGNENRSVERVWFTPSVGPVNRAPAAEARILGPSSGTLGDPFILNGSASTDPDGDELTFTWELPDGSRLRGEQVRWESSIAGDELIITLIVRDPFGGTGYDNITVDVEDPAGDVRSEDLSSFLLFMSPIIAALIVVVIMIAWLRRSRQKRIRRELLRMGLDTDPAVRKVHAQVIEPSREAAREPEVVELVPVLTTKARHGKKREGPPKRAAPLEKKRPEKEEEPPVRSDREVNALVECPFCNSSFKAKVDRSKLMSGEPFRIRCPECGRSGTV